jgi:hypothetical protein
MLPSFVACITAAFVAIAPETSPLSVTTVILKGLTLAEKTKRNDFH